MTNNNQSKTPKKWRYVPFYVMGKSLLYLLLPVGVILFLAFVIFELLI